MGVPRTPVAGAQRNEVPGMLPDAATLALVAQKTTYGIIISDHLGQIEWVNAGFTSMTGYELDEVRGKTPESFLRGPGSDLATGARIQAALAQGRNVTEELLNYRKDGTPYWVAMQVAPVLDETGRLVRFVAIEIEVSERRRAEAATRAKSACLATMSHEIRPPLNAVIGMASRLLDTPMSDEQRHYAETIRTSGAMLLSVLNDLLDFSKIEAGNMELEQHPFDPRACLDEVLDLLASRAAEQGLRLAAAVDIRVPERIVGDMTRVRQILVNLVGNAVKFTASGEVLVRAMTRPLPGDSGIELELTVSDTGIGIPEDRLQRLFQPFSQVDASTTRRDGGTGLGLAISKRLCELMGGRITASSQVGIGSTFSVTLPVTAASVPGGPHANPRHEPTAQGMPLRILLAEDNGVSQQVALRLLERLGYRADLAANGLEVLAALRRQRYDLVLMDVQMPELDGLETTRCVRAELPPEHQPRIAALTASVMVGEREACLAAGMDDYISKPVQHEELLATLRRVRAKRQSTLPPTPADDPLEPAAVRRLHNDLGTNFGEDLSALTKTYRRQLRADVGTMREAQLSGDVALVQLLAHRLRGASATLGAWRATAACQALERAEVAPDEAINLIDTLLVEGERAADALEQLITSEVSSQ